MHVCLQMELETAEQLIALPLSVKEKRERATGKVILRLSAKTLSNVKRNL